MRKRVDLYTVSDDNGCSEIQEFLRQQDIALYVRDLKKQPLNYDEVTKLVRNLTLKHFLNTSAASYTKKKLAEHLPEREEVIEMIAGDNELLRKPIIVAGRLMVIGPNRHKVVEMLQLRTNGSGDLERIAHINRMARNAKMVKTQQSDKLIKVTTEMEKEKEKEKEKTANAKE